ncbi:MAG: carbonic anhydrase [Ferruginibacter sp.]|nr:carbonic anhydrase [Cytophagales bacterium]
MEKLLRGNQEWAAGKLSEKPAFFTDMAKGQSPKFLWIGCSDSRVPAEQITQTGPGELFVHRNVANLVVPNDINLLSVLQYAVEELKVEDIIVCGHYGCGGVKAALAGQPMGLIDLWIANIKESYNHYESELKSLPEEARTRRLVELNVLEQINNLGKTSVIQNAWAKGTRPTLNGWVYDLATGKINVLHEEITNAEALKTAREFERKRRV